MLKSIDGIRSINAAGDYSSAMHLLSDPSPDIVLLDINLPGGSGIDILRDIRSRYPRIIVIMLTNQSDDDYRAACKNLGARYFIDKSKEFEQVPAIIASLS